MKNAKQLLKTAVKKAKAVKKPPLTKEEKDLKRKQKFAKMIVDLAKEMIGPSDEEE